MTIRLNLGSGHDYKEGYVNIDMGGICWGKEIKCDLKHNLENGIPYGDDSVDEIHCTHLIEHLSNPFKFMEEIIRVCKNDAKVFIIVPIFDLSQGHLYFFPEDWFRRFYTEKRIEIIDEKKVHGKDWHEWDEIQVLLRIKK